MLAVKCTGLNSYYGHVFVLDTSCSMKTALQYVPTGSLRLSLN